MTAISFNARKVADAAKAASQCAILPLFEGGTPGGAAGQLAADAAQRRVAPMPNAWKQPTKPS